jgi:hypothetical protein
MSPSGFHGGEQDWPGLIRVYAALHCIWFALYALLGKGFAYAGLPPLYAGEFLLLCAVFVLFSTSRLSALLRTPIGFVMVCFVTWQIICTIPYLELYGIDALRDSVIWAYGAFAWVVAGLILRVRQPIKAVVMRYRVFLRLFLILGPASLVATLFFRDQLPVWPGTSVTIPWIKGGDYGVQLAGIFAFTFAGLSGGGVWLTIIALAAAILDISNRGGLVAFLTAAAAIIFLRPRATRLVTAVTVITALVAMMAALDVRFIPPGTTREISVELLSRSLVSVVSESERLDLENTKGWRLNWWSRIAEYTFSGPFFWTGKGYGINLADSDGFQVGTREEPLRSPHNSHLTFLARSGVPGFFLWISLQLTWLGTVGRSYARARRLADPFWCSYFSWILAFWLAFIVESAFDVSLEGPMAGIPFWTVFGLGWGSQMVFNSWEGRQALNISQELRAASASDRSVTPNGAGANAPC